MTTGNMLNNNGYLDLLSPEIQTLVMKHMTLADLTIFARMRLENKQGVEEYVAGRRGKLLRAFVDDAQALIDVMDRTRTIISGSSALSLVQGEADALVAKDMDVYTTEQFEGEVVKHFKDNEKYTEVDEIVCKKEYDSSAISKIIILEKEGKKVDIIVSHWRCAIAPIIQFHSTSVMNYITSRSLVSLYPRWTTANKGFINPRLYLEDKTNLRTVDALMKYVRRGFMISSNPWGLGFHDCDDNVKDYEAGGYCPHKLRSTVDEEVLRWDFEPRQTLGTTTISCEDMEIMVWCLGGHECNEGDKDPTMSLMFVSA